jgi:Galactose binding lectin domain
MFLFKKSFSHILEETTGDGAASKTAANGGGGDQYETAYACEDSGLNITCGHNGGGGRLNIIRANYGRFSIAICNVHGNTEWSVNCMSPRTLRVIRARCQGADSCQVPVDSTIFGDPCPGTLKYVEVHYSCDLGEIYLSSYRFTVQVYQFFVIWSCIVPQS